MAARTPYSMDVLKTLFEQHFHSPVARVQPLQGELGGSGRSIIRLAGDKLSAIGILDRKSTRLNSSHVAISYAVFCLKKKKINHTITLCDQLNGIRDATQIQ